MTTRNQQGLNRLGLAMILGAIAFTFTVPAASAAMRTPMKATAAPKACDLVTPQDYASTVPSDVTPQVAPVAVSKGSSQCQFAGNNGQFQYELSVTDSGGKAAALVAKNYGKSTFTDRKPLTGLPAGFVGFSGSPKDSFTTYYAYSKKAQKFLDVTGAWGDANGLLPDSASRTQSLFLLALSRI